MSGLTTEEIAVLKEVAQDRLATTRVMGKIKTAALTVTALIAAYILIVENFIAWIRVKLG